MKSIFAILSLLITVSSIGQKSNNNKTSLFLVKSSIVDTLVVDTLVSDLQIWTSGNQIAHIKSSGSDTLVIDYPYIVNYRSRFTYIKVGDKLFKEVKPKIDWKSRLSLIDDSIWSDIIFYNYKSKSNERK